MNHGEHLDRQIRLQSSAADALSPRRGTTVPYRFTVLMFAAVVVLGLAVLAAGGAGYLARRDDATYPAAITRAAAAFAATLTVASALIAAGTAITDR
ncbi:MULTISPECIES: hypothetical protein [unclassified Streptomyces]|uniref:hypothetical protein n=1 Tax=unclassified Streptomyces TaxID=2593676 RepID=UPI0021B6D26D|nr:hypothetical protein [Streptomyces sp. CFMR 7]